MDTNKSTNDLRACPFCGKPIIPDKYGPDTAYCTDDNCFLGGNLFHGVYIGKLENEVERFNTRPREDALQSEIDRLKKVQDRLKSLVCEFASECDYNVKTCNEYCPRFGKDECYVGWAVGLLGETEVTK